jgi:hypothetical protein
MNQHAAAIQTAATGRRPSLLPGRLQLQLLLLVLLMQLPA